MNKFLFFNFRKDKTFNSLLCLMIILWLIVFAQMIDILSFKDNFSKKFNQNMPTKNGVFLQLNLADILPKEILEKNINGLNSYIVNNNIDFFTANRMPIPGSYFNINAQKYKKQFKTESLARPDFINYVQINHGYLKYIKDNLTNFISEKEWNKTTNTIPIFMGNNYKQDYKEGDLINVDKYTLEVKGFINKDTMYIDGPSPINYCEVFDDAIVGPLDLNSDLVQFISIYSDNISLEELTASSNELFKSFNPQTFDYHLKSFINNLELEKSNLKLTFIMMTILNLIIINSIIILKINKNKKNIGIYYSLGANNKTIFKIVVKELSTLIVVSTIISIPITYKLTRMSAFFFVNTNRIVKIFFAIILLYLCISIVTIISLKFINKLTSKELIGGLRD